MDRDLPPGLSQNNGVVLFFYFILKKSPTEF